mgnify:CR=1 FL=1
MLEANPILLWGLVLCLVTMPLILYMKYQENSTPVPSDNFKSQPKFPNLTHGANLTEPYQILVLETTYAEIAGRIYYIDLLIDAYTKSIVAFGLYEHFQGYSDILDTLPLKTRKNTIHHSNTGTIYLNQKYIDKLYELNMNISQGYSDFGTDQIKQRIAKEIKNYKPITPQSPYYQIKTLVGSYNEDI